MMRFAAILLSVLLSAMPAQAMTVTETTSPRGISVWFVQDATTPTVTVGFAFRGGTEMDPPDQQGRAYLMASALTEGSTEMEADVFKQLLNDRNISMGFTAARESVSGTVRYLLRYEDTALDLARAAIHNPAFRANDIARLQAQMLASLRQQEADPDFRAARLTMQQVFQGHAYSLAARGTPQTIKNIKADGVRAAHKKQFTRAGLLVVVVGDTTAQHAAAIADSLFADLPKGHTASIPPTVRQNVGHVWYSPWAASEQNSLSFTAPGVAVTDPDYPAALVLNDLAGAGGFRALLMNRLREELGATYGISAGLQSMDALAFTMGHTSVQHDATNSAMRLIRDTWGAVRDVPFDDAAIDISKNYLQSSFSRDLTSSQAIADYLLGLRLARLPRDYADTFPEALAAVTRDDLLRVAARLYDPQSLSFVVVGPTAPDAKDRTITNIWTVE